MQAGNYEKHSCLHNTEKGLKDKNLQALCFGKCSLSLPAATCRF